MSSAFHTLIMSVSHKEHAELKREAKTLGINLTSLLRAKMGLPRVMVREGDDLNEVEGLSDLMQPFSRLVQMTEENNMLLELMARELGVSRDRIVEMRRARTPGEKPQPLSLAAGYSR